MNKQMVDAEVTIKFIINDICNQEDLNDMTCLEDMVKDIIAEEGLFSLVIEDDDYQFVSAKQIS